MACAGTVVGSGAVVAGERPDVGSNRAAAASAGGSVLVSRVLTGGEGITAMQTQTFITST